MNMNRFLANAWKGNQDPLLQAAAIMLTWIFFIVLGGSVLFLPVAYLQATDPGKAAAYMADPMNFKLLGIDIIWVFLLIMSQFVIGLVGIWLSERLLLKKPFQWVVTGFGRFRWKRMFAGMAVWMGLMCVYQSIVYAIDPSSLQLSVDVGRFFLFLPIAIVFVPLQSAFEEIAIRGQLMQGLIKVRTQRWGVIKLDWKNKPYWPLLLTSTIFAGLHIMNNEIQEYGAGLMLAHYFTFGLVLGAFALIDEGLELSIGIHAGNNIFSLCLVSYPGSSLETPTLLEQQVMSANVDYFVMMAFVAVMYFIFFGKRRNALHALVYNVSTGPTEPEEVFKQA